MSKQTSPSRENPSAIAYWLFACCGLVYAMIIVGAITRLTDSGLSMVEWRPLMGALPPMSDGEWTRVFELYKQSPEYMKQNFWMELSDFKTIFFWEWFHRLLGRTIGLVFALPLLFFWVRRIIPQGYNLKLLGVFILGGLQGLMGWYMVKSGLIDQPDVSHYRLAAHLSLAFLIMAVLVWLGLSLKPLERRSDKTLFAHGILTLAVFIMTMFWGAYTAGLDAGLIYNETFPKMGGTWLPDDIYQYEPFWINFFETHGGVQFTHRWLAMGTALMVLGFWGHAALRKNMFPALHMLAAMIFVQFGLGMATLFSKVAIPLAALHQAGAVMVLILLVTCLRQLKSD